MDEQKPKKDYLIPVSILIAGLMIAIAVVYNAGKSADNQAANLSDAANSASPEKMKPVSSDDHILGALDAPVKIVEYSDLECPYCKVFHETMNKIVKTFGDNVAWVFRHFPLDKPNIYGEILHPKAGKEAQAAECAAKLGGNEKFWAFIDKVFEVTPSNNGLDLTLLPKLANQVGLNEKDFQACLDSDYGKDIIESNYQDGQNAGAEGTPYPIVIMKNGEKFALPGALPFEQVSAIINQALK